MFKNNYRNFVQKIFFLLKKKIMSKLKYYPELVETIEKPYYQVSSINDFHIWMIIMLILFK